MELLTPARVALRAGRLRLAWAVGAAAAASALVAACAATPDGPAFQDLVAGTIADPFVEAPESLGHNGAEDKFVIRSAVGDKEYTIEIPGAARDYDVQVPLADLGESDADVVSGKKPRHLANPVQTDKELVAALPRLDRARPTDTALMDSAFGVGNAEGPSQAPSYTLGLAKVNDHYRKHAYEFALVELNNLLAFYPNSPQLHKMKGTVLVRMRNLPLAELAWIKALELDPQDRVMRAALAKLQRRLAATAGDRRGAGPAGPPLAVPAPIGTAPPAAEPALGH